MSNVFYTVVIYDLMHDRIDYEYHNLYDRLDDARSFANAHSGDDDFITLVARHDINDLSIAYL